MAVVRVRRANFDTRAAKKEQQNNVPNKGGKERIQSVPTDNGVKPLRKIRVEVRKTKRITKEQKEFLLDGHKNRKYVTIKTYASIEPPKQLIGKLKRKPQPVRWA